MLPWFELDDPPTPVDEPVADEPFARDCAPIWSLPAALLWSVGYALFAPLLEPAWLFAPGVLGFAELLPTELVFPEVPVAPVWLVLLWFEPVPLVAVELWSEGVVDDAPVEPDALGVVLELLLDGF